MQDSAVATVEAARPSSHLRTSGTARYTEHAAAESAKSSLAETSAFCIGTDIRAHRNLMQHSNSDISRRRGLLGRRVLIHEQRPYEIRSNGDGDLERPRIRRPRHPGPAARLAARLAIGPIRIAPRHAVRGLDGPLDAAPEDLARVRRRVEPALAEAPELGPLARGARQLRRVRLGVRPQRELPLAVDAQPPLLFAEAAALAESRAQVSVALDGT